MNIIRSTTFFAILMAITFSISGCNGHSDTSSHNSQSNGIPMPASVKQEAGNIIDISFPYVAIASNGVDERWMIQRINSPNNLVFTIIYNHGGTGNKFRLKQPYKGTQSLNGTIKLNGKNYKMISITLNSDLESGFVKLKAQ